jgi:glucose-1-phosphate adenylyltransferase
VSDRPTSQKSPQTGEWHRSKINPDRVASIILGGGRGTRLFPLTMATCKPAITFGGRYRLIDIPISNSLNSEIRNIFVISQFLSGALHHHLFQTYRLEPFRSGFIQLLTAEQRPNGRTWFQGTADAIRQNLDYLLECSADYFLILSGDQLYNMDFSDIVNVAVERDADLTIAALPVHRKDASRMGILKAHADGSVVDFAEKPTDPALLDDFRLSRSTLESLGLEHGTDRHFLGSMGIYVFKRQALWDMLTNDLREDFGKHLIPAKVQEGGVTAFLYDGYWEDIGTIKAFFEANLALTQPNPGLKCYDEAHRIYTASRDLPGAKIYDAHVTESILCEGAIVYGSRIHHSILGPRTMVERGVEIRDSVIMGCHAYAPPAVTPRPLLDKYSIGQGSVIQGAILDRNVHIGKGVKLINKKGLDHYDSDLVYIRDGIIVVVRGTTIPDGYEL